MTELLPERTTGTLCGEMLSQGLVSYRCELLQAHHTKPADDPEPHYAKEVGRTVRAWQAWKRRQMEREAHPAVKVLGDVACPECRGALVVNEDGLTARCINDDCPFDTIDIAQPRSEVFPPDDIGSEDQGLAEFVAEHQSDMVDAFDEVEPDAGLIVEPDHPEEIEVTRAQLELVVANRIRPLVFGLFAPGVAEVVAEEHVGNLTMVAVDAVLGWINEKMPDLAEI